MFEWEKLIRNSRGSRKPNSRKRRGTQRYKQVFKTRRASPCLEFHKRKTRRAARENGEKLALPCGSNVTLWQWFLSLPPRSVQDTGAGIPPGNPMLVKSVSVTMAKEIERKFLVRDESWRGGAPGCPYVQGYLSRDPERIVRVRQAGTSAFITIKGITQGTTRQEFEYAIPLSDAELLLKLCLRPLIEKKLAPLCSITVSAGRLMSSAGRTRAFLLAEIELTREDEPVACPPRLVRRCRMTRDTSTRISWKTPSPGGVPNEDLDCQGRRKRPDVTVSRLRDLPGTASIATDP